MRIADIVHAQAKPNPVLSAIGAVLGTASGSRSQAKGGLPGAFLGSGASNVRISAQGDTAMRSAGRGAQTRQDVSQEEEAVERHR